MKKWHSGKDGKSNVITTYCQKDSKEKHKRKLF